MVIISRPAVLYMLVALLVALPQPESAVADTESTPEPTQVATGDWFVNVATYSKSTMAESWRDKLLAEGYNAIVQTVDTGGRTLHRVRAVGLPTQTEAKAAAAELEDAYKIGPLWVGEACPVAPAKPVDALEPSVEAAASETSPTAAAVALTTSAAAVALTTSPTTQGAEAQEAAAVPLTTPPTTQGAAAQETAAVPLTTSATMQVEPAQEAGAGAAYSGGIVVERPPVATYREAVAFALDYNPAVVSAYYQYEAAREAHRSSQGLFYPSVDLAADYGWEDRTKPDIGDYERESVRFSVTQLLFDGFQARDQARALGYEELSQYYNFHDAAQEVALEVTNIYATTGLYSELVKFAEQNYVAHRQVFNMIKERSEGQLDPSVDLEQATARLALAESNLLSEISNLFETQVEFQRVVGLRPDTELEKPEVPAELIPAVRSEALRLAFQKSPEINREIEDLRSAREELNATRGPLYPRVDLRYRNEYANNISGFANDISGITGDYEFQAIELLLTYNLYRGGADSARRREYAARYYAALEDRKDACLGIRQQVSIIFNNLRVLKQQVVYLTTQLEAQDNTRRAYKDQFQIGQRSLLDLLDSQNEFFDTQRALVTAEADLVRAQAAILAETGVLTDAVGARGFNAQKIDELKLDLSRRDNEEIPPCAFESVPEVAADQKVNFERLDAEAEESDFMQ